MLILQTEVRANQTVKYVEFMPLPAVPKVTLAPERCFTTLRDIVARHKMYYVAEASRAGIDAPAGKTESVKIVAEHQLGPHTVTVVEIKAMKDFVPRVEAFFKSCPRHAHHQQCFA